MKKVYSIIILVLLVFVVGCSNNKNKGEEKLNIVTSFYPMYVATSNIVKDIDNISLTCLANPEVGCLHDYQLTVNDMITLETADIFVINGGGMESFLDKAVSTYPDLEVVNASEGIIEDYEYHEEDEEDDHLNESNSHIWVSIDLHIKQIEKICEELKEADPENANKYEENKINYIERLNELKEKMHLELDNVPNKNIITFHEAFYYFAEEFGLNIVSVIEREPGTSPSAGELAEIIEKIKNEKATAIFVEPGYEKTAANVISRETAIPIYELDPITSGAFNDEAYIEAMNKNLVVLMEALNNE